MTSTQVTPRGRFLGRIKDRPDPRDHFYAAAHRQESAITPPPRIDLRDKMPAVFDQGDLGSCELNAASGLMCHLYPAMRAIGFSRLQLYFDVRTLEGTVNEDSGCETRDVMRVLQLTGAAPENLWPYDVKKFKVAPPVEVQDIAEKSTIESFARLITPGDYLRCLAAGFPFMIGVELFDEFEGDDVAKHGVIAMPDMKKENTIGGHAMLAVGYDLNFKATEIFKASGLSADRVADQALLVRNSWGGDWGDKGYCWLPIPYVSNPSIGGDAWTGRLT